MSSVSKRLKWSDAKESILIDLWTEKAVELRGPRKNMHIYSEMADSMCQNGFIMTAAEVKVKLVNLTAKYKKEKKAMGVTGASPSEWKWYDSVHKIIGNYKSIDCSELLEESYTEVHEVEEMHAEYLDTESYCESGTNISSFSRAASEDSRATSSDRETAKKKYKKRNYQGEILDCIKEGNEMLNSKIERLINFEKSVIELETQKVELLRRQVETADEFKQSVIRYLNNSNK